MSFPTKLLQQLRGAGSGRQGYALQGYLVVFAKCVCVYALCGAGSGASLAHAAAKCAPVLVLAACCLFVNPSAYGRRVALALAASAAGDALLVWERLAAGMACFAAAHLAYLAAFPRRPALLLRAAGLVAASALLLPVLRPRGVLARLVPGYAALLCAMCWRARAAGRLAGAGAALFVLSDAALGYHMFASPIPYPSLTVMSTYYAAQLLLALSAITRPAESPAPAQPAGLAGPAAAPAPAVPCGAE